jgi:leader peptidase (prepilin peptidase)/N-methyltransferase
MENVPFPLVVCWALLVGAVVGSFLNVVIARVPAGQSVVHPRSRCPRCGAAIAWYDNVPVVSWILLRARCRACGASISIRYPLVEVLGAAAAGLAVARHGLAPAAGAELAFAAALVALAFIDLDTWLLPHAITWPLIAAGVLAGAAGWAPAGAVSSSLAGAGAGFAAFALIAVVGARIFRKEALGWGDVWLLAGIGAWLGIRALVPVVLLSSLQGSVFGIALILLGRAQPGPTATNVNENVNVKVNDGTEDAEAPPPEHAEAPPPEHAEGVGEGTDAVPAMDDDWVPPRNAVPFGPFLALAALEWLYLGSWLGEVVPALGLFR